ncbi:MAG: penicillin-binding protein 1A [Gammaproteobacteria bacterium]|nr:MAG: penicillin-binding protein 1A [Gammaproteobacteria bacterium]
MRFLSRFFRLLLSLLFSLALLGLIAVAGVYFYFAPQLPSIDVLSDIRLQVPLKVYTRDRELIAEFGEKRRSPVKYQEIPDLMVKAFLAAEDDRFFEHPGVDYQGITRAVIQLATTGKKTQGGSTITMQVARNFFLSSEKTYERKIKEILLALKIEQSLDKEQILELYLNKIYLGNRAYGVGAAAEVYYAENVKNLTLAQIAMIAGLPKAPSRFNPIANPKRALIRREYVLNRMRKLDFIDQSQLQEASAAPVTAKVYAPVVDVEASYVAEMVRAQMVDFYGDEAYTAGFQVITAIDRQGQQAANDALRRGLETYDQRHGYRGPEAMLEDFDKLAPADLDAYLKGIPVVADLLPGVTVQTEEQSIRVYIGNGEAIQIDWEGLKWARRYVDENKRSANPKTADEIATPGSIVRVKKDDKGQWKLTQVPAIEGAFISLNPDDGAIWALTGGYDFYRSKFNRAIQSKRQPGSGFKPLLYTTALESGLTPATTINDAPIVYQDDASASGVWRPQNYSSKFFGPTRLREALYKSRNLVSVRLIEAIGVDRVVEMSKRFGFKDSELPNNLTLALGSASTAPLRMSSAYAVFANGGFRIKPYLINYVEDIKGKRVLEATPLVVCEDCLQSVYVITEADDSGGFLLPLDAYSRVSIDEEQEAPKQVRLAPRILSRQVHYQISSMLRDVVKRGTGRKAMQLGRNDLAGKTGTTNDQHDAWFNGFHPEVVGTAWVGFDQFLPLGRRETGGKAALPVWIEFMRWALVDKAQEPFRQPDGMVTVKIDSKTGLLVGADEPGSITETFRADLVPSRLQIESMSGQSDESAVVDGGATTDISEDLF